MSERRTITLKTVDRSRPNRVGVQDTEDRWYGVVDRELWPRLTEGANLNVEWAKVERDGKTYYNITGILGTASNGHAEPPSDRERNIIRESALSSACSIAAFLATDGQRIETSILQAATVFETWITRQNDIDEPPF